MPSLALRRAAVLLPGRHIVRLTRKQLVLAGIALLLVAGAGGYGRYWWSTGRFIESTDDAYVGGNVTVLAPHVPGFVSQIRVDDNQYVKAGDLLVTLDDRDYRAKLAHAEAAVQRQKATLDNLHAQYELQQSMIAALYRDARQRRRGTPRRAKTVVATRLPRGCDDGLCRRVSGDHARLCRRDAVRPTIAQSGPAKSRAGGRALTEFRRRPC